MIGQRIVAGNPGTAPTIPLNSLNVLPDFHAAIQNYRLGDQILFNGLTNYGTDTASGNVVTVFNTSNTVIGSLSFVDAAGAADPLAAAAASLQITCYAAGTLIGTPDGPRAIETLAAGDEVRTLLGGPGRIVWAGSRAVECARHPRPEAVWPVRIARGAFGAGVPSRDLRVSPDHALYVDGALIPAKLLVNGTTVRRERVARIVYHHIELARHDAVLAEGLAAETYLDTGDRGRFSGGAVTALYPDFAARTWEMKGCAPLVLSGEKLERVREGLQKRSLKRRAKPSGLPLAITAG